MGYKYIYLVIIKDGEIIATAEIHNICYCAGVANGTGSYNPSADPVMTSDDSTKQANRGRGQEYRDYKKKNNL